MGCSASTVNNHVTKGLATLRTLFTPRHPQPPGGAQEQYVRASGQREPVVTPLAQPGGCLVDGHVAALQAGAATA